eukprot:3153520-Rhodomonas_salina.2
MMVTSHAEIRSRQARHDTAHGHVTAAEDHVTAAKHITARHNIARREISLSACQCLWLVSGVCGLCRCRCLRAYQAHQRLTENLAARRHGWVAGAHRLGHKVRHVHPDLGHMYMSKSVQTPAAMFKSVQTPVAACTAVWTLRVAASEPGPHVRTDPYCHGDGTSQIDVGRPSVLLTLGNLGDALAR